MDPLASVLLFLFFGFIGLVIGPIILVTTGRLLGMLLRPNLSIENR